MMLPQQLEEIARERIQDWVRDAERAQRLGHRYTAPPRWQQWTGRALVWMGTWLMRWGTAMAPRECQKSVPVAGSMSS